jgi:hypothetical protein
VKNPKFEYRNSKVRGADTLLRNQMSKIQMTETETAAFGGNLYVLNFELLGFGIV